MPAPISVKVSWDTTLNKGTCPDISVPKANGATMITWTCDTTVANFTISGLDDTEFNPASSNSDVTTFTTNDRGDVAGDYSYTVQATHALTGAKSSHDPKITNEP